MCGRPAGMLMPCLGPGGPGPREPPHESGEAPLPAAWCARTPGGPRQPPDSGMSLLRLPPF